MYARARLQGVKCYKMKKSILKLALAATLLMAPAASFAQAENAPEAEATEQQATVVEDGDNVIITVKGVDYVISQEEYQAELDRGLSPRKVANNKRISEADKNGVGVTVMAMAIVLAALIVLSILFMIFGKIFGKSLSKKKREAHGVHPDDESHDDSLASGETIAAIALALDEHFNSKHDLEDTVLTIRRMKRAYSPWNSKIYNMREVPALRKNVK